MRLLCGLCRWSWSGRRTSKPLPAPPKQTAIEKAETVKAMETIPQTPVRGNPGYEPDCLIDIEAAFHPSAADTISLFFSHVQYAEIFADYLKSTSTRNRVWWHFAYERDAQNKKHIKLIIGDPMADVFLPGSSETILKFSTDEDAKAWETLVGLWKYASHLPSNERQLISTAMKGGEFRREFQVPLRELPSPSQRIPKTPWSASVLQGA
ncbi:hypothetical protein B0T26DRAFT_729107 [Lasiosphaeria miniovina]|uniref:Uncharacterized protein n=1 Tax=Lasiosphaeria miniovina TaxID=1954250 RepID=A0AA40A0P1_9PEZI|nr:uncharacterized protein B0T26DRAFT_729107 [Lasiosphaeria miniovina]KAK0707098.1 hypothetical protein B0T26DRAFT_729107 [Lasiosphaeria miniovina]